MESFEIDDPVLEFGSMDKTPKYWVIDEER